MLHEILDLIMTINGTTDADIRFDIWKCVFIPDLNLEPRIYIDVFGRRTHGERPFTFRRATDSVWVDDIDGLQKLWDELNDLLAEKIKEAKDEHISENVTSHTEDREGC